MPTRNIVKDYAENTYYHAYNRGVDKQSIFREASDYQHFTSLLETYLSLNPRRNAYRQLLPNYHDKVALVAYCLMGNHYHMLLFAKESDGIEKFMRSIMTAYSMYFNKKYARVGALFQNHFLASRIDSEEYLWSVSRYIHLNPLDVGEDPFIYPYSSLTSYTTTDSLPWIHPEYLLDQPNDPAYYKDFVASYQDAHQELHAIKKELADRGES